MNRVQRRHVQHKRNFVLLYAAAAIVTVGVMAVMASVALAQKSFSLAWWGNWAFLVHQAVMLVLHVRGARRCHREMCELIEEASPA